MIRSLFPNREQAKGYCGRLAPTPSGPLHEGHVRTFSIAAERARACGGRLLLRIEDIDRTRCRAHFVDQAIHVLRAWGLDWDPPIIHQATRYDLYLNAATFLARNGWIYPSPESRREISHAATRVEAGDATPLFPVSLRPATGPMDFKPDQPWRFRVPEGERLRFQDGWVGDCTYTAGEDFGDFLVWRRDGWPSYELAVVVDDIDQSITEVVRGADLLKSTARQLLLYRAFEVAPPTFVHCPLILDPVGRKLSKSRGNYSLPDDATHVQIRAEAQRMAGRILSPKPPSSNILRNR